MEEKSKAFSHAGKSFNDLKKFPSPRFSFMKTKALDEVLENMKHYEILHLHGMSGSGKSQTVAAVCKHLDVDPGRIIWYVQCQEIPGAIVREWKELLKRLKQAELITAVMERGIINGLRPGNEDLLRSEMTELLNQLNLKLTVPLLLVVEDVALDEDRNFIDTLIECMKIFDEGVLKIQLLIATQNREAIYQDAELNALDIYKTYHIRGFSEQEAFEFLTASKAVSDQDKVRGLARELAYSPLGLFVTKSYCFKYDISYETFADTFEENEDVKRQKDLMNEDHDLRGKRHRHEIILKLLAPEEIADEDERIQKEVMLMIALLSNEHIPTKLIERFFAVKGQTKRITQRRSTRALLDRLEKEVDAIVWHKTDEDKLLSIHSDVSRALRNSMGSEEKPQILANVVTAFASILDKDNRKRERYLLLHDLKNHAEVVAGRSLEHFDDLVGPGVKVEPKDYEMLLGLSKIYEVIGFAISQHPGMREGYDEDEYYEKATVCIWTVVCSNTTTSLWSYLTSTIKGTRQNAEEARFLIDYKEGKVPEDIATKAYKMMKNASLASDEIKQILQNDSEWSYPVKMLNFDDMKKRLGDDCGVDWAKLQKELEDCGRLSDLSKKVLQNKKMLVSWEQLNQYYLAEKLSSILHSRGRLDNYKGDIIPVEMHTRCIWYVKLGLQLCEIAFQNTGVKSLFHYILTANNQLPRLVRDKENESDEEFMQRINQSRNDARSVTREREDFYEHGIYKHVSGTPFTLMNALKYLVKANTKVYKRPELAWRFPSLTADQECDELYKICKENTGIPISTTCMVHAGKYYAAREDYGKALEVFMLAFNKGIDQKVQANATTYAWALYNMGRAILAAGSTLRQRQARVEDFNRRYNATKSNNTPDKWRKILDELQPKIQ